MPRAWIASLGTRWLLAGLFASILLAVLNPRLSAQEVAWSMVVLPDTQNYYNPERWAIFNQMTQWIVDNKESRNIQVVLHEGDITDNNIEVQWAAAAEAMGRLNGEVPYILSVGNHDILHQDSLINQYFAVDDNPLHTSPNGIMMTEREPGDLENTYSSFTAPDGRKMLIFSLEYVPSAVSVDWANEIAALPEYQDHTAVLLTHHYLEEADPQFSAPLTPPNLTTTGQALWSQLVSEHNFELTFNGHSLDKGDPDPYGLMTTARQSFVADNGVAVHSMVFNTQQQPFGGNGYLRLVEFLDDGKTIQVKTYSPFLDVWLTDINNEFQLELTSIYAGDFNDDGVVDQDDHDVWQQHVGTSQVLPNDPTPGVVDASDLDVWNRNLGHTKFSGDFNNDGTVNDHDYDVWLAFNETDTMLPNDPTPGHVDHRDLVQWQNHLTRSKYASYFNGYEGDFNGDGYVDMEDFELWEETEGTTAILHNDATIGVVDQSDLELWTANFALSTTAGDYNGNGIVDAADYTVWRDTVGTGNVLHNDATPGTVDENDFEFWKSQFGIGQRMTSASYPTNAAPWATVFGAGAAAASPVPEPSAAALAISLAVSAMAIRRRFNRCHAPLKTPRSLTRTRRGKKMSPAGLEPAAYGLKVRCSTD